MKTSPEMQNLIQSLAAKHHFDLGQSDAALNLELEGYLPLGIERIGQNHLAVYHSFIQNGDLVFNPEVIFFTGYEEWVAMDIELPFESQHAYGVPNGEGTRLARLVAQGQADLASFCAEWASNLQQQGWLEKAHLEKARPEKA